MATAARRSEARRATPDQPRADRPAHEWTHALDHALSGGDDLASDAAGLWSWWPPAEHKHRTRALGLLDALPPALGALALAVLDSPVYARSRAADRYRSARYYSTLPELLARAVERAVVAALADDGGRRNDYLANVHESSPVHATIDEARPLVPLVRAVVAERLA